jgi:hypothetical protein
MSTDPLPHEEDYHGLYTPSIKAALILPNAVLEQISTEENNNNSVPVDTIIGTATGSLPTRVQSLYSMFEIVLYL